MLVDTSVWIDFFNGHPSSAANRLGQAIADGESITLPGVVITEILMGLKDDAEAVRIANLLRAFDQAAEFTSNDYEEAARLYRTCRSQGLTIRSTIDCLIAQIALRDGLPILSKDRDFKAIAACSPLQLIDLH